MVKVEFEGHKLEVPSSWAEVTLGEYEKWHAHKPQTQIEYVKYIAEVCKLDADVLLKQPTEVFEVLANAVKFVFNNDFEPSHAITIGGEKYFLSPFDKLSLGEWVDVDSILNDDEAENKLSQMLAILCRPVGEDYNYDRAEERAEMFRQQSCDKVLPLISFFLHKEKRLKEILHHCSTVVAQANLFLKDTKTFAESGDGIKRLPIWQRIRYRRLTKSLEKQLSKFSGFSFTE